MFRFAHTDYLYALFAIPIIIILFWLSLRLKKKSIRAYGDFGVISQLMSEVSYSRPVVKFIIVILALTSLIFGIAGPQFGSKLEEMKREGVEIIIAIDVSNSMMAQDIQPNRLELAKRAISKMIDRLHNDKIGLIVFAGDAYTQLPITTDYAAAKMFLSSVNIDIVPKQGTAIGAAIDLGTKSFGPETGKNKALIIITDGENHEDNAVEAAGKSAENGIIVHTIGMGLPKGAPIPVYGRFGNIYYRKDKEGNIIISKLNETMLQQIASAGGGIYIRADNTQSGLNTLFDEINKMEKKELESSIYSDYEDRFQYIIALALIFLLFDFIILERKNRLLRNIHIFNK